MAAIVLKQLNPGYIDRHGAGSDALDKTIDALRMRYNKYPLQGAQFFKTETPKGGVFKISTFGTTLQLPTENQDSASLPFATPIKGFPISFTVKNYRMAVQVERSYVEDQLQDIARKQMSGLMNSARLLLEYNFASVINNASSTSYTGADGMPLSDPAHPHARRATGTWSNEETAAALTSSTWATARKNMRKRPDEFGHRQPILPRKLVVCADIEQKARELKVASKIPETATNQPWVFGSDDWDIVVWDYMTSTTAWFLVGNRPAEFSGMHYCPAVRPGIAPTEGGDKSTDIIWGQRLRMRFVVGFSVEPNIQYNAGA